MNMETAGWAFTLYYVFKVIWYLPAGRVSDGLGHYNALLLALVFQAVAVIILWLRPDWAMLARTLEGIALAQSTISSLSALRMRHEHLEIFSLSVNRLMLAGSIGFLLGPVFGFLTYQTYSDFLLFTLLAITFAGFVVVIKMRRPNKLATLDKNSFEVEIKPNGFWRLIVGMAAVKCVLIGWQLNMVFWTTELFGTGSVWSGISFIILGVLFAVGSIKPSGLDIFAGMIGMIVLEIALVNYPSLWWLSLILLGYWFGSYLSYTTGRLGWNRPEKTGSQNSFWLALTDLPSAFVPVIMWQWRQPEHVSYRVILGMILLLLAFFSLWGIRHFRAPIQNSQV